MEQKTFSDKDAASIALAEKELAEAHITLDIEVISNFLHPDYVILQPNGILERKKDVLESYREGQRKWNTAWVDQLDIRVHGDTGIVTGLWHASGVNKGRQFDYQARFLSVWLREGENWQNIAYHSTEIP